LNYGHLVIWKTLQIWAHAITDVKWWKGITYPAKTFFRVAGSGAEENRNNTYPTRAAFAQPSGEELI